METLLESPSATTGWEKEWLDFLAEWYAPGDSIVVNTSGSTGTPKPVRLSKAFVAASARRTLLYFGLEENDRVLHGLPSRYIAGKLMVVRSLLGQLDMHVADPSTNFDFLDQESFKFAAMVPNQVTRIIDSKNGINRLQQIKKLLIGGSSVPAALQERLRAVSTDICSSYAMTETATHIAIRKINGEGADHYYHCMEGIKASLSPDGCLRVHVPGLDEEYLQTTDLAEVIDEKTFRILGRADHVIISGGIKFHPEQLEQKLEKAITQPFMISSLPDDKLGEQIVLLVEGTENPETVAALHDICHHYLDRYEQPRQIRFIEQLPRTPNGKLLRSGR
ncbi:MAG: AMP-binding protein [Mangrovibacterium sp.]|nr:AMP-binding protein [Mangrovibacterium sp.]